MTVANARVLDRHDDFGGRGAWEGLPAVHGDQHRISRSWMWVQLGSYARRTVVGRQEPLEPGLESIDLKLARAVLHALAPAILEAASEGASVAITQGTPFAWGRADPKMAARRSRWMAALTEVLSRQPDDVVEAVSAGIGDAASRTADAEVWGPPPGLARVGAASVRNQMRLVTRRDATAAASLTMAQTAALTGMTEPELAAAVDRRMLLAFEHEGTAWVPIWQLSSGAPARIRPEVAQIVARFRDDAVTTTHWMLRPNVNLEGSTPLAALAEGRVDDVLRVIPPIPGG